MKRSRYIKKWWITMPRVAIREPGIYEIKGKVSQITIERTGDLPKKSPIVRDGLGKITGEIKRGSVDGDE